MTALVVLKIGCALFVLACLWQGWPPTDGEGFA